MKPSIIVNDININNRDKFGIFLRQRRSEMGLTVRNFAKMLNVSAAYISDIEQGNRRAPLNHIEQMIVILKIEDDQIDYFYDLAGCSHSNWPDINDYLKKNPNARKFLRLAKQENLSGKDILELVNNASKETEEITK